MRLSRSKLALNIVRLILSRACGLEAYRSDEQAVATSRVRKECCCLQMDPDGSILTLIVTIISDLLYLLLQYISIYSILVWPSKLSFFLQMTEIEKGDRCF